MTRPVNPSFSDAQLITEVRCRRCAYDLRGLTLEGRCPECGLEIWPSVEHIVDPAASTLPKLRDPRGVGNALVWLIFCGLASTILLVTHGAMTMFGSPASPWPGVMLPEDVLFPAAMLPVAGLWSAYMFAAPRGAETDVAVRTDVRLIALALLGWGASGVLLWYQDRTMTVGGVALTAPDRVIATSALHLAIAMCGMAGLHGLRGVLRTIGRRSREYRRAQGGRQGIKPMMAAAIGVAIGSLLRIVGQLWDWEGVLNAMGTTIERVCMVMILIGLGYLLVNATWIRRSLRKPPPRLEDLVRIVPRSAPSGGSFERRPPEPS